MSSTNTLDLCPPVATAVNRDAGWILHAKQWAILVLCLLFISIHLYAGLFGAPVTSVYLGAHLTIALIVIFLQIPMSRHPAMRVPGLVFDAAAIAVTIWTFAYIIQRKGQLDLLYVSMTPLDYFTVAAFIVVVLEAARRAVGPALPIVAICFCLHALYADHFPGMLYGPPASMKTLLLALFVSDSGIFGIPLGIVAQYVVLFIVLGQLLVKSGAGGFFTRLSIAALGHRIGGPAKAAVLSSSFMGSLSGSPISNVLTTGAFTIPLMRRLGYRRDFAGGVESAASTGGMVMPPVMGAVAFMMAEFLGVPYVTIMLAAIIPSALFSLAVYFGVHFEAKRHRLKTMDRAELESPWAIIRSEGYRALPLVVITGMLLSGASLNLTVLVSILFTLALAVVQPRQRMTPLGLLDTAVESARSSIGLSATVAAAGIVIGAIFATGLSFQVTQTVTAMGQGQLWLILVLSAVTAFVLGMGLTIGAVYITMAATVIPLLVAAGIEPLAAHFFALYYGTTSFITPPVAMAAFAAAPIANAPSFKVGVQATRLGIGMFLLPFLFVYNPALLLVGTWGEIALATGLALAALFALAICFSGYFMTYTSLLERALFLAGAIGMIAHEPTSDVVGIGLMLAGMGLNAGAARRGTRRAPRSLRALWPQRGGRSAIPPDEAPAETQDRDVPPEVDLSTISKPDTVRPELATYLFGAMVWLAAAAAFYGLSLHRLHARDPILWLVLLGLGGAALAAAIVWSVRRSRNYRSAQLVAVEAE